MAKRPARDVGKTPKKTPVPRPDGRGALLVGGNPGNAGGPGRPPNWFKQRMAELADRVAQSAYLEEVLDDPKHPNWPFAVKHVTEHGHGKPKEHVEHSGEIGARIMRVPVRAPDAASWAASVRRDP